MSRLTIDAKAEADVEDAARWYEGARAGLGFDFLNAVESAYRQIAQGPERYPVWRTLSDRRAIRKYVIREFPYVVLFLVRDSGPHVVAVAHSRRRPGFWRSRL